MADVHVGTDTRLGRKVAVKLLRPSLANDPRFRLLFREEAQKAARMAHPTIVRVFDAGEETVRDAHGFETQLPFIVMEYVDGRMLKDIIADGPLEPSEAARIAGQVLTALEYSHRALLVHRDIKPGNIMVTQSGQVKVMDFGIARAVSDNSATVADTSAVLGTAQYFSPEQARGETVDARTDLYSTGVVLFELLTGKPPFHGERPAAVAYQHISETPVKPSSLNPKVSPALDAVVLHSLAKDKFERFQSAAEFRADLEAAAAGELPVRKVAKDDFNATLFGVNPNARAGSEATMRQLSNSADDRVVRTQSRPPVAWIWAGITIMAVILIGVTVWVLNLKPTDIGSALSVNVPDIVGMTYESGAQELMDLNLVPTRLAEASDTAPEGTITRVDPEAGTNVAKSYPVRVWVSTGRSVVSVPAVTNMTEEDAIKALKDAGLEYGQSNSAHSPTVAAGVVMGTSPDSGASVRQGTIIDLLVSDGLVTVPKVTGLTVSEANSKLAPLGLNISIVPDDSCIGNKVASQSLSPGDHPQKSSITLRYCSGSPEEPPAEEE
ncbi:Stk1 family PASTA domain-containing Ser/Thr kinase [Leifsonia bigeumensis]|uniref:non-specific serine/threonine protein kinase n=2 Tax=Leifsonella bigeumensis TaxID=433643 RepID=A0ABP7F4A4_9MICO